LGWALGFPEFRFGHIDSKTNSEIRAS